MLMRVWQGRLLAQIRGARTSTKILVFFIFASLGPLYALLYLDDAANSKILLSQQLDNITSRSVSLSAQIDDQLGTWSYNSRRLALEPAVAGYLTSGGDPTEISQVVRLEQQSEPNTKVAFILDLSGKVVASSDPAVTGSTEFAPDTFFKQAALGTNSLSDLSIGHLAPLPAIYFGSPVRDAVGHILGVAALRVDPAKIIQFFNPSLLGVGRYGLLVDQDGIVIGTSGPSSMLYHSLGDLNETQQAQVRQNMTFGDKAVPSLGVQSLAERAVGATSPGSTSLFFKPASENQVFGYAPLKQERWVVVVGVPERVFLAPVETSRNNTAIYTTLAALIFIGVIFLVARLFERTERQSMTDSLTGLPNRRYFHEILQREMIRSQRNHRPMSLINVDLDHFKQVNDEYGHGKGDEILKAFAKILKDAVRSIDLPVRFGGEEFLVLLPDTDKEGAVMVAEKIRRAADRLSIPRLGSMPGRRITVSAGVATHPSDTLEADELMRCSDQAMYLAKNMGRNQVVGFGMDSGISNLARHPEKVHMLVQNANKATIEALAAAIDARDTYTHGHSHRVADYARVIASEIEDEEVDLEALHLGALLHDVGKIGISDQLLRKPTKLTPDEYETIKSHAQIGYEMIQGVEFLRSVGPIILHHHENYGGGGYPTGIHGKDIPVESRIIMICDAFDAMTSTRTYRKAGSVEGALDELARHAGRQFDPDIVEALRRAVSKGKLKLLSQPPLTKAQMDALAVAEEAAAAKS